MPIYEYACRKCGHEFEVLIRKATDVPSKCPTCGAAKPAKAFSTFAVSAPAARKIPAPCRSCPGAGGACGSEGGCCSME